MIDPELLRKSGWSEELISAAIEVAEQVKPAIEIAGSTEVLLSAGDMVEGNSTVDLSGDSNIVSTWPRF